MYVCEDCGRTFDEPIKTKEKLGEFWGAPAFHDIYVCPYCESEEIDKLSVCPVCGEPMKADQDFCNACENFVSESLNDYIKSVQRYLKTDYKTATLLIATEMERR